MFDANIVFKLDNLKFLFNDFLLEKLLILKENLIKIQVTLKNLYHLTAED